MDQSLTNQDLDMLKITANVLRNPFIKQMAKPLTELRPARSPTHTIARAFSDKRTPPSSLLHHQEHKNKPTCRKRQSGINQPWCLKKLVDTAVQQFSTASKLSGWNHKCSVNRNCLHQTS